MTYHYFRHILIGVFLVIGAWFQVRYGFGSSRFFFAAAFLLTLSHLLMGGVSIALTAMQAGKTQQAEKILKNVWFPSLLLPKHRAYYYFCQGLLALHKKELAQGITCLQTSLAGSGLKNTARGLALLNLAHAFYLSGNKREVASVLDQIDELNLNDLKIKEGVQTLRSRLKEK